MEFNIEFSRYLEEQLKQLLISTTMTIIEQNQNSFSTKEWMSLAEGAKYAGVSYNTFMKFRLLGLKVSEIDGIKRVSRKEIDRFLEDYSF